MFKVDHADVKSNLGKQEKKPNFLKKIELRNRRKYFFAKPKKFLIRAPQNA